MLLCIRKLKKVLYKKCYIMFFLYKKVNESIVTLVFLFFYFLVIWKIIRKYKVLLRFHIMFRYFFLADYSTFYKYIIQCITFLYIHWLWKKLKEFSHRRIPFLWYILILLLRHDTFYCFLNKCNRFRRRHGSYCSFCFRFFSLSSVDRFTLITPSTVSIALMTTLPSF